jgi:cytidine deaminase
MITHAEQQALIAAACDARRHAHAPYSEFSVGAALLTSTGQIISGANVENASFGLTLCAERVAIGAAVSAGHHRFAALAIVSPGGAAPCGACRQVMAEFCADLSVLLVDSHQLDCVAEVTLDQLLPRRFFLP